MRKVQVALQFLQQSRLDPAGWNSDLDLNITDDLKQMGLKNSFLPQNDAVAEYRSTCCHQREPGKIKKVKGRTQKYTNTRLNRIEKSAQTVAFDDINFGGLKKYHVSWCDSIKSPLIIASHIFLDFVLHIKINWSILFTKIL